MNPNAAPGTQPVDQSHLPARLLSKLRDFNRPPDQSVPTGLGAIVMLLVLALGCLALGRILTTDLEMGRRYSDAAFRVTPILVTLQATIFAFDPRKRTFGYLLLLSILALVVTVAFLSPMR